ncbi:hypothetical protein ACF1AO_16980 [Streptomyces longwoodensis]|uniref:hypothetical protein n=1 Tax=Streptomyces longwoodensis TaxID=68231 RepID=UPI0036F83FAC
MQKQRPTLRVYDPRFFFPQWGDEDEDCPSRVHLAWELPADDDAGLKARVRRVTYELGPIFEDEPDGDVSAAAGGRQYPWEPGRTSNGTCYLTDAEWLLEDLKNGETLDQLPMNKARFWVRSDGTELNRLDLMIDFVPVVHIANTIPEGGEQWGRSILAQVLQALDELAATDSDSFAASATTGTPIIGLAGARLPVDRATGKPQELQVKAGAVWQLSETVDGCPGHVAAAGRTAGARGSPAGADRGQLAGDGGRARDAGGHGGAVGVRAEAGSGASGCSDRHVAARP